MSYNTHTKMRMTSNFAPETILSKSKIKPLNVRKSIKFDMLSNNHNIFYSSYKTICKKDQKLYQKTYC